MGSNETAITIPGGLEKLTFFTGTGRHRVQIIYFFRMQIGSRTPSGIGLGSGGRLRRICGDAWGSPESSGSKSLANHGPERWSAMDLAYMYVPMGAPAHAG